MNLFRWLNIKRWFARSSDSASPSEKLYAATECGHQTLLKGTMTAYNGETIERTLILNDQGTVRYCLACHEKMIIPCAWCGLPILTGDPITLYTPRDPVYKPPDGARVYKDDPFQLVGCLRWDCAQTGADRAGFWMPPGEVERVLSPLEQIMLDPTHQVVIVGDLGDRNEAVR